jgi:hypothetical protein
LIVISCSLDGVDSVQFTGAGAAKAAESEYYVHAEIAGLVHKIDTRLRRLHSRVQAALVKEKRQEVVGR